MQRIQGHNPATISPSTSHPSAQANNPLKARRASGHPPLSHQTQIMKAVRRSSALPSLSISIPPAPADDPILGSDGPPGEPLPKREERTKTVTFSGPEEEEEDNANSSDQSSICQSPSWEQYSRKKKKKPKKRDVEQSKNRSEEKVGNGLKKKGNKLSKVQPPNSEIIQPLSTTNRSQSAPELDLHLKSRPTLPSTMANPKLDGKSKSKGFLSGFRLQHGNVSAVQKLIDSQRISSDGSQPEASPMLNPHVVVSDLDPSFANSRKPPSIRSALSNSTRSISSLDQLPPSARHSANSSHGRSQSLLTSTLNKLKGPSYLYYRPTEVTDNAKPQRPSSSHESGIASNWSNDPPTNPNTEQQRIRPKERVKELPMTSTELAQQLPDFTFPSKSKRTNTQPVPDSVAHGVRGQAHGAESKELSSGHESPEPTSFRTRRAQIPQTHAPGRDSSIEKEKRPRSERASRVTRQQLGSPKDVDNLPPQPLRSSRDPERYNHIGRQGKGYVQTRMEIQTEPKQDTEGTASTRRESFRPNKQRPEQLELNCNRGEERGRESVGTHTSAIQPHSRRNAHSSTEMNGAKHVTFPSSPNAIGRAVTSDAVPEEVNELILQSTKPQKSNEVEDVIPVRRSQRPERSGDYFTFISQSYAPPSLELRSPSEGKFPSPRIDEEPEAENHLDHILKHMPLRNQVYENTTPFKTAQQTTGPATDTTNKSARSSLPKDLSYAPTHYSDSDISAFERLGLSPKAARVLAGVETLSTSPSQSNTDPSRTNSERSSSSTYDDTPPSPSTAPTSDSSRLQQVKQPVVLPKGTTANPTVISSVNHDETTPRGSYRPPAVELSTEHGLRHAGMDTNDQDDSWSRTALPIELENHTDGMSNKSDRSTSSPPLVATPSSATFPDDVKENFRDDEAMNKSRYRQSTPLRAQSALELHSPSFLPDNKHQPLNPKKVKEGLSSISLPNTPPEITDGAPRRSAMRTSRKSVSNGDESSALVSPGAAYLQEARKTAPIPSGAAPRAVRPPFSHKNSSNGVRGVTADGRSEPLAKMLVECCNCKFFHDMPSRVYECMAKPDSLVEDKLLGVSATITTMVKCPWCAHGMTTQCCSGYAAVVYLKEKLHGK